MGLSTNGKPITPWQGSWAHEQATQRGMSAAYRGVAYDANPYERGSKAHLAWSSAHNGARANKILKEEGR